MERYGEIPPRFTKAWWGYYWYYYKWHTIGIAVVAALLAATLVQCAHKVQYDLQVTYAGDKTYTDQGIRSLTEKMEQDIDDITGNEKNELLFQQITIAKNNTSNAATDYDYAMVTKLDLDFQMADTYLYLFSGEQMNRILNREHSDELFEPVDEWAAGNVDAASTSKRKGIAYAVNLAHNAYFEELGFITDDLYIAVRAIPDSSKELEKRKHDNAVKLANRILGY